VDLLVLFIASSLTALWNFQSVWPGKEVQETP
jgi:hypothetical protein